MWILVRIKENVYPPKQYVEPEVLPDITLFVTAYNEGLVVDMKMENCLSLDYPKERLSIYWITDGSTDNTNERLACYTEAKVLYHPDRKGKTAAINRGMQYVTTPLVVFTDANTLLNKDALKEIVKAFSDTKTGCVAGEKRVKVNNKDSASPVGENFYWRYESKLKDLDSRLYSVVGAAGELFAIRTNLFERMPENILLDDFVLSLQIVEKGFRTVYCKEAFAIETASLNMNEEEKRKERIAAGGLQALWKLRSLLNICKYGVVSFQFISHRLLRWTITPIATFLLLPLNIVLVVQQQQPVWFYLLSLIIQIIFYLFALIGKCLSNSSIKSKFLFIPYYFLFMNVNVFKGILYLKRYNNSFATWEKVKRF